MKACRYVLLLVALLAVCEPLVASPATPAAAAKKQKKIIKTADPRGEVELTVCSQNLQNFGLFADEKARSMTLTPEQSVAKDKAIAERIVVAGCDVVAVQEVLGKDSRVAGEALSRLASLLKRTTNRPWEMRVGEANEGTLHNGFLIAQDRAEVSNSVSYHYLELPSLAADQKPRQFGRGPLEIQLEVKGQGESGPKTVTLISFHFKSKAGAMSDPTGLEWEPYRLEMAEGLRRVLENRHLRPFATGDTILIALGDRNSEPFSASAHVLDGSLNLKFFQSEKPACRLSKKGAPICVEGSFQPQRLFSVLTRDPQTKLRPGTLVVNKRTVWIDDILLPAESLPFAQATAYQEGDYDSGVLTRAPDASDHAMVWLKLNW